MTVVGCVTPRAARTVAPNLSAINPYKLQLTSAFFAPKFCAFGLHILLLAAGGSKTNIFKTVVTC